MNPITNADIRNHATGIVRQQFGKVFPMMLVTALAPSVIVGLFTAILNAIFKPTPMRFGFSPFGFYFTPPSASYIIIALLSLILSALVYPAVMLGLYHGILNLIRGMDAGIADVFSRVGSCLNGFLLSLYVGLRTWLWILPGFVLSILGAALGNSFGVFLMIIGVIAMYVLVIPAAFRYCMALPALADQPELGVFGAFNRGKEVMQGRKWQLFKLLFLYGLIMVGVAILFSLLITAVAKIAVLAVLVAIAALVMAVLIGMVIMVSVLTFYGVYADAYSAHSY